MRWNTKEPHPGLRYFLGALLAFIAFNAFGGGYYGMVGAEGVPREWLMGSPFKSFFVPSLILFVVVGGSFLAASIAVFARSQLAPLLSLLAGSIALIWIVVQVSIIGYVSWLQPAVFLAGLLVLALSWVSLEFRSPRLHPR